MENQLVMLHPNPTDTKDNKMSKVTVTLNGLMTSEMVLNHMKSRVPDFKDTDLRNGQLIYFQFFK
jgi:hypothetical protein